MALKPLAIVLQHEFRNKKSPAYRSTPSELRDRWILWFGSASRPLVGCWLAGMIELDQAQFQPKIQKWVRVRVSGDLLRF